MKRTHIAALAREALRAAAARNDADQGDVVGRALDQYDRVSDFKFVGS